jgi:endonuclease YncB( thermonuclease family)
MRSASSILVIVFASVLVCPGLWRPCCAEQLSVVKVYNGAEAKLSDGRKTIYSGISVPREKEYVFFQECREAHQRLVKDASLIVLAQPGGRDKDSNRIPVVAFIGTLLINAELIRQGYALAGHSDDDFRYRDLFLELQHEAFLAGRGMWAYKDNFSEPYYIGSRARRIFHRPDCSRAKNLAFEDREVFRTKDDALAAGQVQCWLCSPLFRIPAHDAVQK